ncbi:AAA family ATPase [Caballeronia arvi]|uniref:AAA family ATPase n=1 Tax=Caballeronia arvi TaxID=1777135 RepID=UPI00117C610E|nr:AAA family ATPase [Caballeronia arvi]
MNSNEALEVVENYINSGKVMRFSPPGRASKAIIYRTVAGRCFAVELNEASARRTKLVFEASPGGVSVDWNATAAEFQVETDHYQFKSTAYSLKGANLEPGKQISVYVENEETLRALVDWYAETAASATPERRLDRAAVEAAMDMFDKLGPDGFKAEYPQFNEPKNYWVRPSRSRPFSRYPSKLIAAIALGVRTLNGGLAARDTAASLLHNTGYIIVDGDDRPEPVPASQYPHLISGAERIRACAFVNYIAPAQDRGDASVMIVAGKLHNELGLSNAWANVCQALRGPKFLDLVSVPTPDQSGPDASTTTTFTYRLKERASTMSQLAQSATNLILYGPPGTGKTYETVMEAVRLCLGEARATPLFAVDRRDDLMKEYRKLTEAGRIDFITFHQSYSYEDFVEGLRPTTDAMDVPLAQQEEGATVAPVSGGFRLCSVDRIFKLICDRARLDRGDEPDDRHLDRHRPVFKIALGRKGQDEKQIADGLANNLIHLGWGSDVDWSEERFDNFEEIRREWNTTKDPNASGKDPNIEMTYSFRSAMQIGDYVVLSDGRDTFRAFGIVTGEYFYDTSARYHPHRRKVKWIWQSPAGADRDIFYKNLFRRQSVYQLRPGLIQWDALESIVCGEDASRQTPESRPYVLIIDEINRANISKVFGELITLLEPDKRLGEVNELKVKLPYSDGPPFGVPANLHIIGTMNTADRSIALLDTALRRRFQFRELMPKPSLLGTVGDIDLAELLKAINARIEYLFDREHQIGHAYLMNCESREAVENAMRHRVIPLLAEYFYEDWGKVAAVLGDADEGDGDREGGFLNRKKLVPPKGMGMDGDAPARFRWTVREKFDFSRIVRG